MSWIQKLYETYEHCASKGYTSSEVALTPLYHVVQQAHIEIALDGNGNFRRASVIDKENTVIPATEKSATARTSAVVPHPLCDHVKYCAGDYIEGDESQNEYFEAYCKQLRDWCVTCSHPKAVAILKYVEKKTLLHDLIKEGVLPVDSRGRLLKFWKSKENKPHLLKQLTPDKGIYKPQNALIRWRVEFPNDPVPEVWSDTTLQNAWIRYCTASEETNAVDLCMVTGIKRALSSKHPNRIRGGKDNAKLISNKKEEDSDFIYLGRFLKAGHAVGVGIEVSQKAHSALQWLIKRQGFHNGDQTIVAWAVSGKEIPDPFKDSDALFGIETRKPEIENFLPVDAGQNFALRLNKCMAGYRTTLGETNDIVVMALDSATPGRMAITYYRELTGSEFLDRVQAWHEAFAWNQNYSKDRQFVGAPSPKDIAEAAFGRQIDKDKTKKLLRLTVERLLPCILDGRQLPRDLMESATKRACNRSGMKKSKLHSNVFEEEWEKTLGIACALFRGYFQERNYQMTLEQNRTTRDYLYGCLLAIAEHIEGRALYLAKEKRETCAARLIQRFADRPFSTWRTIELSLSPYKTRLRSKRPLFLNDMEKQLDEVNGKFHPQDFLDDRRLSGEFLLGYHCQRQALWNKPETDIVQGNDNND